MDSDSENRGISAEKSVANGFDFEVRWEIESMEAEYRPNSITLIGAVSMGTGIMIGASIFALTGQVAELAGPLFPMAFLVGVVITAFSACSYVKMSNAYPSAGGIAMILEKAYGPGTMTGACAILMALSIVINESLVARTFGTYTLQLFDIEQNSMLVPTLGVGLLVFAFVVNVSGNRAVGAFSLHTQHFGSDLFSFVVPFPKIKNPARNGARAGSIDERKETAVRRARSSKCFF